MGPRNNTLSEGAVWPSLADYWHPVAYSHEVTDKPVPVKLLGENIVVCRLGNVVSAFSDLCIHRGTPISLGWIENDLLLAPPLQAARGRRREEERGR